MSDPSFTIVFEEHQDGFHTFRIPAVITTPKGTILAFAEGRMSRRDISQNAIVLKRSTDGGNSWGKLQIIFHQPPCSLNNPTVVFISQSHRILLMFQLYPGGVHEHNVQSGFDSPQSVHNYLCFSDDDGLTWSIPRDITKMTKRPSIATSNACGPGIGIELKYGKYAGRIIIPFNQGPYSQWEVYTVFSDDNGETWQLNQNVPRKSHRFHGNEAQLVERADGSLLLNCRSFGKSSILAPRCRKIAISHDGGYSWSEMQDDRVLIESSCQASLFRFSYPENGDKSRILFSNPAVQKGRYNGTIRLSYDEGMTWAYSKTLVRGYFAYSCLTRLVDGNIGCLFETGEGDGYNNISFTCFSLRWLTENKDLG